MAEVEPASAPWPGGRVRGSGRPSGRGGRTGVGVAELERVQRSSARSASLDDRANGVLRMYDDATIENGQPLVLSYTSSDGEVTVAAPSTWEAWLPGTFGAPVAEGQVLHEQALDVWSGSLRHPEDGLGSGERIELVDPVAYDAWCAANGGSPLLSAPADAAAIAQQVIADPNFETTGPVSARVGGIEAVSIDVALAPGGKACGIGIIRHQPLDPHDRVGFRVAPTSLPRRSPGRHVGSDPGDHGRSARGALRRSHRRDRTDHRLDRVPPAVIVTCPRSISARQN